MDKIIGFIVLVCVHVHASFIGVYLTTNTSSSSCCTLGGVYNVSNTTFLSLYASTPLHLDGTFLASSASSLASVSSWSGSRSIVFQTGNNNDVQWISNSNTSPSTYARVSPGIVSLTCFNPNIPYMCFCPNQTFSPTFAPTFGPTIRPTTQKPTNSPSRSPSSAPTPYSTTWQIVEAKNGPYTLAQFGYSSYSADAICLSQFGTFGGISRRSRAFIAPSNDTFGSIPSWPLNTPDVLIASNLTDSTRISLPLAGRNTSYNTWLNNVYVSLDSSTIDASYAIPLTNRLDVSGSTILNRALVPPKPFWFGFTFSLRTSWACSSWTNSTDPNGSLSLLVCTNETCAPFCCTIKSFFSGSLCANAYRLLCLVEVPSHSYVYS